MKNKKGEIATLLTLGLVVLGAVITLSSSFFVSKTKIASNPKAAGVVCDASNNYNCGSTTQTCSGGTKCGAISTDTSLGCKRCVGANCQRTQGATVTYPVFDDASGQCSSPPVVPAAPPAVVPPAATAATVGGSNFDTCYKAYRLGYYDCKANENKVVIYAPSMSAVDMPSCEAYNKGTTTALYFAQAPWAYVDGACAANVWDDNMDLGAKNQQASTLQAPPPAPVVPAPRTGNKGESCLEDEERGRVSYSCNGSLVCLPDNKDGICVTPTPPPGGVVRKTKTACPNKTNVSYWKGNDGKFYKSQTDTTVYTSFDPICYSSCSDKITCSNNSTKSYYQKYVSGGIKYFENSTCDTFLANFDSYCTEEPVVPVSQNVDQGTGRCEATHATITVSGQSVIVEKSSDLFPVNTNGVSCGHILVARTATDPSVSYRSVSDITVYRECPGFLQGTACIYSCFNGSKQVNCEGTSSSPVYDQPISDSVGLLNILNTRTYPIDVKVGTSSTTPQKLIFNNIPSNGSVTGEITDCSTNKEISVFVNKTGDSTIENPINREIKCGGLTIIKI